ncbi:MAG: BrnT family toxin [Chthoniobacterales bacterium]
MRFEWDLKKETENIAKHGVDFREAQHAFFNLQRVMLVDHSHGTDEPRFFCIGRTGRGVLTVRFTYRAGGRLRIIGAGYWRKGRKIYEEGQG